MLQEFKPVLRNKSFRYLWISQITSQLSINIMNFVFLIWLFGQTGSAISTSFLWVAYSLPAILVGPFALAFTQRKTGPGQQPFFAYSARFSGFRFWDCWISSCISRI